MRKIISFFIRFKDSLRGQIHDQWGLLMLELDLPYNKLSLPEQNKFIIREATKDDIENIKLDIYPVLEGYGSYDKRIIERIGEEGITCMIATIDSFIVHYFFVFDSALNSPLSRTPINKSLILETDAALGSQFTNPNFRGQSISIYSLSEIFRYLNNKPNFKRLLTTIHKDTPGAQMFHQRLGFKELESLSSKSFYDKCKYLLTRLFANLLD